MWLSSGIVVDYVICFLAFCLIVESQDFSSGNVQVIKACDIDDLRVHCEAKQMIAVHDAIFTTNGPQFDPACAPSRGLRTSCIEDIKKSVNEECSGLSHCLYNFTEAHIDRRCQAPGTVVVSFVCVPEYKTYRSCNAQLTESEGYIVTPGFPNYYPTLDDCMWSIAGGSGQTVQITIIDIQTVPPVYRRGAPECVDALSIYEGTTKLLAACENSEMASDMIESKGNSLKVKFTSTAFASKRGVMMKYNLRGCPTLSAPKNGYLVYRNESVALYMCCKDYVFVDTQDTTRVLHCIEGNRWNASMRHCIPIVKNSHDNSIASSAVHSVNSSNSLSGSLEASSEEADNNYIVDIVVPCVLMAVLLLGNVIIILVILKFRKKQKLREAPSTDSASLKPNAVATAPLVTEP